MKKIPLFIWFFVLNLCVIAQHSSTPDKLKIDSIIIKKNWRTRDKIILREIQFQEGETIDRVRLENSISRIWNIGNFADVSFKIDTIPSRGNILTITAKDAFTLLPILSYSGNKNDYNLTLGIKDNNFLGRNVTLDLKGNLGTFRKDYDIGLEIPRQLLYRNMTLSFQLLNGTGNNFRYAGKEPVSAIAYRKTSFSGSIGNPFHTDYHYTFSPNVSWNLFLHKADSTLTDTKVPFYGNYEVNYLALGVGESVGIINRKRHQHNGYLVSLGYGVGIGLNDQSPFYHSVGFSAAFYKLFNRITEISAGISSGLTTAELPSLIYYLGSGNVKGLITGEESGNCYYSGYMKGNFTYFDRNWFALEQTFFLNYGKAAERYSDLFQSAPRISIGTGIRIWTPMIPWLSAGVQFAYLKGSRNWFFLDI